MFHRASKSLVRGAASGVGDTGLVLIPATATLTAPWLVARRFAVIVVIRVGDGGGRPSGTSVSCSAGAGALHGRIPAARSQRRWVVACCIDHGLGQACAFAALACYAQAMADLLQVGGAVGDCGPNLTIGNPLAKTNVHVPISARYSWVLV